MTADVTPTGLVLVAPRAWYWQVIRGVLTIAFGVVAIAWPGITATALVVIVGIFALITGIAEIVDAVQLRGTGWGGMHALTGAIGLVVGIVLLAWPSKSAEVLVWIIGLWLVVAGLLQVAVCLLLRPARGLGWGWGLFAGLVAAVLGLIVLFNVDAGLVSIVWIIGLAAIAWGLALIVFGLALRTARSPGGPTGPGAVVVEG